MTTIKSAYLSFINFYYEFKEAMKNRKKIKVMTELLKELFFTSEIYARNRNTNIKTLDYILAQKIRNGVLVKYAKIMIIASNSETPKLNIKSLIDYGFDDPKNAVFTKTDIAITNQMFGSETNIDPLSSNIMTQNNRFVLGEKVMLYDVVNLCSYPDLGNFDRFSECYYDNESAIFILESSIKEIEKKIGELGN